MAGNFNILFNISEAEQEASFMNATLQSLDEHRAMSIAVHMPVPEHARGDEVYLHGWLQTVFQTVLAAGGDVEIQIGSSRPAPTRRWSHENAGPGELERSGYIEDEA